MGVILSAEKDLGAGRAVRVSTDAHQPGRRPALSQARPGGGYAGAGTAPRGADAGSLVAGEDARRHWTWLFVPASLLARAVDLAGSAGF